MSKSSHDRAHEICGDGRCGFGRWGWFTAWSAEGGVVLNHVDLERYFSRPHDNHTSPIIRVADLGCATGSNTFDTVDIVVETLRRRYTARNRKLLRPDISPAVSLARSMIGCFQEELSMSP
ncbi:hypothetical protein YC2023_118347 [Brassica napus]